MIDKLLSFDFTKFMSTKIWLQFAVEKNPCNTSKSNNCNNENFGTSDNNNG